MPSDLAIRSDPMKTLQVSYGSQSAFKTKRMEVVSQTKVLASNRQTTYGKPGQHRLHQGRLSWEKKYFVNCHHRRCAEQKRRREG